jgi:hypothetical protein
MSVPPTGTVTFLFTDIEGSTKLWERTPQAMHEALVRHDELLKSAIEACGGYVFKTVGDAFRAAFSSATDAAEAALASQLALLEEGWAEEIGAAQGLRESAGIPLLDLEACEDPDHSVATDRSQVEKEPWEREWEEGASKAARSKPEAELKGVKDQLLALADRVLASDLGLADATMVAQVRNFEVWVELRGARAGARVPRLGGPGVHEA